MLPGGAVVGALWLATLAASDVPWPVITAFWMVVGGGILLWVRHDLQKGSRDLESVLRGYESALRVDRAEVFDIRSDAFVEFQEVEDEGACFAFEIEGERLVFLDGQAYYPGIKFPSHDFSLVHIVDEHGRIVDSQIEKRGPRAEPKRVVPASRKLGLRIPEHLEVVDGRLDDVEALLAPDPP